MSAEIHVAEFLFRRLRQAGLLAVHGVPGDYNLKLLDYITPAGLEWIGNCNELNAGYAADGYGRIKGISAVVTTFGVGELSAINAIAGSYAEMAPVVHIVGTPTRGAQRQGVKLHHSLCNGRPEDFAMFAEMYSKITVVQENLMDSSSAAAQIDHAIEKCILQSRPVYIQVPMDMVEENIPTATLARPLKREPPANDMGLMEQASKLLVDKIKKTKQPLILVDVGALRYNLVDEVTRLVKMTGFPTATTPFGKGIIDETLENFHGIYGSVGKETLVSYVEACDLVINIGPVHSNVNTYYFTTIPDPSITATFNKDTIVIDGQSLDLFPKAVLQSILSLLQRSGFVKVGPNPSLPNPRKNLDACLDVPGSSKFKQDIFWRRISSFFRPGDIILAETGTAGTGARDFVLPQNSTMVNSGVWLSIGYMLAATQGVALAQRHLRDSTDHPLGKGRTILFEGDGSFQLTAQELSTIIRYKLDVILFVVNNNGYTIERLIHGMEEAYNDVAPWRYLEAPSFFGAPTDGSYPVFTARASTWDELDSILEKPDFHSGRGLRMVELIMDPRDCTETLRLLLGMYAPKD